LTPTTLVNLSTVYRYDDKLTLSLIVNNLANKIKRGTLAITEGGNPPPAGLSFTQ